MCRLNNAITDMFATPVGKDIYDRILATVIDKKMDALLDKGYQISLTLPDLSDSNNILNPCQLRS